MYDTIGMEQVRQYNHGLACSMGKELANAWGTYLLVPEELCGFMVNVVLPSTSADAIASVQAQLDSNYHIYVVYSSVTHRDTGEPIFFVRLSGQVYLEPSDFLQLISLVPELLAAPLVTPAPNGLDPYPKLSPCPLSSIAVSSSSVAVDSYTGRRDRRVGIVDLQNR